MSNDNGMFVRRQELTCTQAELNEYGAQVILGENEVCYIRQSDGRYAIVLGDGVSTLLELSEKPVLSYSELSTLKAAAISEMQAIKTNAVNETTTIKSAAETAREGAEAARDNAESAAASAEQFKADVANKAGAIMLTSSGKLVHTEDSSDNRLQKITVYGKSKQTAVPKVDVPAEIKSIGYGGNININILSNNLIDIDALQPWANIDISKSGTSFSLVAKNAGTYRQLAPIVYPTVAFSGVKQLYMNGDVISSNPENKPLIVIQYLQSLDDNVVLRSDYIYPNSHTELNIPQNAWFIKIIICMNAGNTAAIGDTVTFNNLVLGATYTDAYTPFRTQSSRINGIELCGIPVSSGGNVNIDGQEYIADTLTVNADGTGSIVRRILATVLNGTEEEWNDLDRYNCKSSTYGARRVDSRIKKSSPPISDKFPTETNNYDKDIQSVSCVENGIDIRIDRALVDIPYENNYTHEERINIFKNWLINNPVTVYAIMNESDYESISLSFEQVQAFLALNTYKPISNIYNSDGAYIEATYIADTQAYIDNKFKELENAILAQGGNV